jgi:hypothetical protein
MSKNKAMPQMYIILFVSRQLANGATRRTWHHCIATTISISP